MWSFIMNLNKNISYTKAWTETTMLCIDFAVTLACSLTTDISFDGKWQILRSQSTIMKNWLPPI